MYDASEKLPCLISVSYTHLAAEEIGTSAAADFFAEDSIENQSLNEGDEDGFWSGESETVESSANGSDGWESAEMDGAEAGDEAVKREDVYKRQHLFWRYDLTAEQLFYMVNISLKYFVALPVAILFISATNPSEFAASLNSIGISYKVGYSVAIALRYIPDIQRDYHSISQAQQARGVELGKNEHFFARLKNSVNILLPLILTSLNRIDTISNAMELRGFGKDKKRTWYMKRPFEKRDFVAIGVGMVLLVVSMTVTILWGRFYNPFV